MVWILSTAFKRTKVAILRINGSAASKNPDMWLPFICLLNTYFKIADPAVPEPLTSS